MKLDAENLFCGYQKNAPVIKDVSFSLSEGEVLAVLGANGSGKTTLFKALLRFIPYTRGCVAVDGKNTLHIPENRFSQIFSYIPQNHQPVFPYTVQEMALMGRAGHISLLSAPGATDKEIALEALAQLNILHLKEKQYTKLSGGERKLVLIARALCQQAKIIVMDEPSADLDYANQQLIANTIAMLKKQGYSIILSTHAPEYPFSVADTVLLLKNGETVACGNANATLTKDALSNTFGTNMDIFEVAAPNGSKRKICLPI